MDEFDNNNNIENEETKNEEISEDSTNKVDEKYKVEKPFESSSNPASFTYNSSEDRFNTSRLDFERPIYTNNNVIKKNKKPLNRGAAVVLVICCMVFSLAAGFFGSYLFAGARSAGYVVVKDKVFIARTVQEVDNTYSEEDNTTVSGVVDKVASAVVEVTTEYTVQSTFYNYIASGAGSGVIVSEDGYIITNNHVIVNQSTEAVADSIQVTLNDNKIYFAQVVGRDPDSDIAVLKIEATDLNYVEIADSDELVVGESVVAIGNPLGRLGGTVTTGIISGLSRQITVDSKTMTLLQTDAAINPGNSGGGLFNMAGKLIGIVNAKTLSTSSGTAVEGVGFAIPSNTAYAVFKDIMEYGYVRGKIYIGVSFYDITSKTDAFRYFNSNVPGVYVTDTAEGYNDDVLQFGDRIVTFDGVEVSSKTDIQTQLATHKIGDIIKVSIVRKSTVIEVTITVFEKVPTDIKFVD